MYLLPLLILPSVIIGYYLEFRNNRVSHSNSNNSSNLSGFWYFLPSLAFSIFFKFAYEIGLIYILLSSFQHLIWPLFFLLYFSVLYFSPIRSILLDRTKLRAFFNSCKNDAFFRYIFFMEIWGFLWIFILLSSDLKWVLYLILYQLILIIPCFLPKKRAFDRLFAIFLVFVFLLIATQLYRYAIISGGILIPKFN